MSLPLGAMIGNALLSWIVKNYSLDNFYKIAEIQLNKGCNISGFRFLLAIIGGRTQFFLNHSPFLRYSVSETSSEENSR